MQDMYYEEYDKVYAKDQTLNKDLNVLAIEDLKKATYFFEYLRTSKKLYHLEQEKLKKQEKANEAILEVDLAGFRRETVNDGLSSTQKGNIESIKIKDDVLKAAKMESHGVEGMSEEQKQKLREGAKYQHFREEFKDVFEIMNERK